MRRMIFTMSAAAVIVAGFCGPLRAAPIALVPSAVTSETNTVIPAYYYHRRYYRYRWHGGYYPYYWHGNYYRHRHWRRHLITTIGDGRIVDAVYRLD
jgi:hypothetical protein